MMQTTNYTNLSEGTEIYYTGDMANQDGYGVITAIVSDRWYAVSYNILLEDGREMFRILPNAFGTGRGNRFWVRSERVTYRRAEFCKTIEGLGLSDEDRSSALERFDANN